MGRACYDEAFFLPPAPTDPCDASIDNAREIGTHIDEPRPRDATLCYFDDQQDLVYGREIRLYESVEECFFRTWDGKLTVHRAIVAKTRDQQLRGCTILTTGYPYSTNTRDRARLWPGSKDPARYQPARTKIGEQLSNGESLDGILQKFDFDPCRTDDDGILRAYFFGPVKEGLDYFSNRRASKQDLKKAERYTQSQFHYPDASIHEQDSRAASDDRLIRCWGICESYEAASRWLYQHDEIQKLLGMASDGVLFKCIPNRFVKDGEPPMLHQVARDAAEEVLQACIHNALCGTFSPEEYRGVVTSRRTRGLSRKQTVASHLWHLFYDAMLNLHRRSSGKGAEVSGRVDSSQQADRAARGGESTSMTSVTEFREQVADYQERFAEQPISQNVSELLRQALRRKEDFLTAMALAVAYGREMGVRDEHALAIIREQTNEEDGEIQQVAREALRLLESD